MERYIVDRIEDEIVVCEEGSTGEMVELEIYDLPEGVQEGDILIYEDGEYTIDDTARELREDNIKNKMDDLWE